MRWPRALSAVLTCLVVATGCAGGAETGTPAGHNEADVEFATDMIQHHAQALAMVDLTLGRELAPEVATLVEQIRSAQAPEIETMSDWLEQWHQPVPETVRDHANAHDHGGDVEMDMPGMMTEEQMTTLEDARDGDFQAMWLEMMIEHHAGAVEMARVEQEEGQNGRAVALAKRIARAQTAEVETMEQLLRSVGANA